jgi:DNA-binding SARP family transcriptional activator
LDVAYESFAQPEIQRLEELELKALEDLFETMIELGEAADAVSALRSLVVRHPLRERLRRLLMLALHSSGRSPEALMNYIEWSARLR